ncbi:MAG: Nif11-like leader peptide family natural product precursor [Candidatus Eremiobacterota bacterium]
MSIEAAKAFIERMKTDEDFAKKVAACKDAETRKAFVKNEGFEFTLEELTSYRSELTDDQLGSMYGGTGGFCFTDLCKCITVTMVEVSL